MGLRLRASVTIRQGFTLVELVIVIAIIGILASLLVPLVGPVRDRAEKVVCIGNLRSIYLALGNYLNDNQRWPQTGDDLNRDQLETFWRNTLASYDLGDKSWICPSFDRRLRENPEEYQTAPKLHYMPAQFSANPMTPRKWAGMPWALEVGGFHGGGALYIRADGSVASVDDLFKVLEKNGGQDTVVPLQ